VSPHVVTLGEVLVAFVRVGGGMANGGPFEAHVVGAEANVAVGLTRLGHPAGIIGRIGDDPLGELVLRQLRADGVDVSHMTRDTAAPTGVLIRELRPMGPSEVVYHRAGSAGSRIGIEDVRTAARLLDDARLVHVTGITPALSGSAHKAALEAVAAARRAGALVSFDVNFRGKLWGEDRAREVLRPFAAAADIVLAGQEEAELLTGCSEPEPAARALLRSGAGIAVVKLGAEGALALDGQEMVRRRGIAIPHIVDPVGAGDAFGAGFLSATLDDAPLSERLERGNACAVHVMAQHGDLPGLPTRAQLEQFLARPGLETSR
jgi:2-dehydro-3-deoxygluconokinase